MQVVDLVVSDSQDIGDSGVVFGVGVGGQLPHLGSQRAHLFHEIPRSRGQPFRQTLYGMRSDVLCEIAAAFQFGQYPQDQRQAIDLVSSEAVPSPELTQKGPLGLIVQSIDELVPLHQYPGGVSICSQKDVGGGGHGLMH